MSVILLTGGACMAGGMHGRGHAWQGGMRGMWGACIGACMAGGMYGSGEGGMSGIHM